MHHKKIYWYLAILLLFGIGGFFTNSIQKGSAAGPNDLQGWIWSDTIGWISLDCATGGSGGTSICGTSNYSVTKDGSGNLSGYGWSDSVGWIKFDPAGPYPTETGNTSNPARIEVDNTLSGWIRACAATVSGNCNSATLNTGSVSLQVGIANTVLNHQNGLYEGKISIRNPFSHSIEIPAGSRAYINSPVQYPINLSNPTTTYYGGADSGGARPYVNIPAQTLGAGQTVNLPPTIRWYAPNPRNASYIAAVFSGTAVVDVIDWDGWISLKGPSYYVTLDANTSGFCTSDSCGNDDWSWGSEILGWMDWRAASINAPLTVSCSASPSSVSIGQQVTWTATVTGGTGPYTYVWSGSDSLSGSTGIVNKSYSSSGTKTASVSVNGQAPVNCSNNVNVGGGTVPQVQVNRVPASGETLPAGTCTLNGTNVTCGITYTADTGSNTATVSNATGYTISYQGTICETLDPSDCDSPISGTLTNTATFNVDADETARITFTYTSDGTITGFCGTAPSSQGMLLGPSSYDIANPPIPPHWDYTTSRPPGICKWTCAVGFERVPGASRCRPDLGTGEE